MDSAVEVTFEGNQVEETGEYDKDWNPVMLCPSPIGFKICAHSVETVLKDCPAENSYCHDNAIGKTIDCKDSAGKTRTMTCVAPGTIMRLISDDAYYKYSN
jgi:hypothetical protein